MRDDLKFVLVTPARNEAQYIGQTLESLIAQRRKPLKWIVVSDGSTDGTNDIVSRYAESYGWIELVRLPVRHDRHFEGKVRAFNAGYERLKDLDFEVIGNLDGDVILEPDYFDFLIPKFAQYPRLGVAGTPFREGSFQYDFRFTSPMHVSGQCQMFRRECFDDIGGYRARKIGGIDLVAVTTARMKGWETRTFVEKPYIHQRRMGSANANTLMRVFNYGVADYILGSHPLWQLLRCVYLAGRPPILLGAVLRLAGFSYAVLRGMEKQVDSDFVRFRRGEQMTRLREMCVRGVGRIGRALPGF